MLGFVLVALTAGAPVCGPASAPTIAENDVARVYRANGAVYGCAAGGAPRRVAAGRTFVSVILSGRYAGVVRRRSAAAGASPERGLWRVDLRSGAARLLDTGVLSGRVSIPSFVVTAQGLAVWIERVPRKSSGVVDRVKAEAPGERHNVTSRVGPLQRLTATGRTIAFTDAGRPLEAVLPTVPPTPIDVSPRLGDASTRFAISFRAPPSIGRHVDYIASVSLAGGAIGVQGRLACVSATNVEPPEPGVTARATLGYGQPWCRGGHDGEVILAYGGDGSCGLPCSGHMSIGTFRFRVR